MQSGSYGFGSLLGLILRGEPGEPIARTDIDGLTVSTVFTADAGPETAIVDSLSAYPVERYASVLDATEGHARWCEKIVGLREVTRLGYGDLIDDEVKTLVRVS